MATILVMVVRSILFLLLSAAIWAGDRYYYNVVQPTASPQLTIAAMNGGDAEANRLRVASEVNNNVTLLSAGLTLGVAAACFGGRAKRGLAAARDGYRYA